MAFMEIPSLAGLELVDETTKHKGETTITWDSSFHDRNYIPCSTITVILNWGVDSGAATFNDIFLKILYSSILSIKHKVLM